MDEFLIKTMASLPIPRSSQKPRGNAVFYPEWLILAIIAYLLSFPPKLDNPSVRRFWGWFPLVSYRVLS